MGFKLFGKPVEAIIWDWNGTLLNDLELCVNTINQLLSKRGLPLLSFGKYKEVFSFPVKDYYQKIGFDFTREDFAIPAREFIDIYNSNVNKCSLHSRVVHILEHFKINGVQQFVLSAMKEDKLKETLIHTNIYYYFEQVLGLNDHYAVSKMERSKQLFKQQKIAKDKSIIIGDTIHDFEVAQELGVDCILIADGHQSKERLEATNAKVLDSLDELLKS